MKKTMAVFSTILICAVFIRSQDLSDLVLIAHYPLSVNNEDTTLQQLPMTLTNTPFEQGGITCNGIYVYDENGCQAITPRLINFTFNKLAISATFKVTDPDEAAGNPLFVGGENWRWLRVEFDSDSLIGFGYNNEHHYTSNTWHTVTATYDSTTHDAECYLDGVLADHINFQIEHGNEKKIGITDFSNGHTFKGYLKDLKIFSLPPDYSEQDSMALVALYNSTGGANWTNNTNWLTGPVDTWYGITVEGGRVKKIELGENNLDGILPADIGNLTQLEKLSVWSNQLFGSIPPEIGLLGNIEQISVNNNYLTGSIPSEIGNLDHMFEFNASRNMLDGPIPEEIGGCTQLANLFLSENQLSGAIPVELGNCFNLYTCYLSNNQLSEPIPESFGNLSNLTYLRLHTNQLSGEIPGVLGQCTSLKTLMLSSNQFTGSIPSEFENLTQLTYLSVGSNQMSGPIIVNLGNISTLEVFACDGNQFTDLPDLSGLANLRQLHIYNNQFTFEDIEPYINIFDFWYFPQDSVGEAQMITTFLGDSLTLSVEVGGTQNQYQWYRDGTLLTNADASDYTVNPVVSADSGNYICVITNTLATNLTLYSRPICVTVLDAIPAFVTDSLAVVDFYHSMNGASWINCNWFNRPIADWIGVTVDQNRVMGIKLRNNNLSGTIPATFSNLSALTSLDLADNNIAGEIPAVIFKLDKLAHLSLTGNVFTGLIPAAIGQLPVLERLYLARNALTGSIPAEIGQLSLLRTLHLYNNQLEGSLPDELYDCTNLHNIHLNNNHFEGAISAQIENLTELEEFQIAFNQFKELPDLSSNMYLVRAEIQGNRFTFEDVEPNMNIPDFTYAPQDSVGEPQSKSVTEGSVLVLSVDVGGQVNEYRWLKGDVDIGTGQGDSYQFDSAALSDAGDYICMITNPMAPDLTLYTRPVTVQVEPGTASDKLPLTPQTFALRQNYPNPFNPETQISFDVKEPCRVELTVYNLMGQEMLRLIDQQYQPGTYDVPFDAQGLESGLYFYHIQMGDYQAVRKMVVLE
ncbi:immunoglobulin domain-containing protein [bacterium]|nr:immunoglobulin domain-containing protein [bacterium]